MVMEEGRNKKSHDDGDAGNLAVSLDMFVQR